MKTKYTDKDIEVIAGCVRALNQSTSRRMLRANIEFLVDRFLVHPIAELPKRLREANCKAAG